MDENTKIILLLLTQYLEANPTIRFCQALSNLNINEIQVIYSNTEEVEQTVIKDNYYNSDELVLSRINLSISKNLIT